VQEVRLPSLSIFLLSCPVLSSPLLSSPLPLSLLTLLSRAALHRRYVDSIDTCEAVLLQYPDYPRIREEILKKAQGMIRGA